MESNDLISGTTGGLKLLPSKAIRLIGSSQVISSINSVVKELVENSLDAGATSVDIRLDNFGLDKIEIKDNGCGVKGADVGVMCQPHYTSKIYGTGDLATLHSYGFRGEALGSLCALAEVAVTTKTKDDAVSKTYLMDHKGTVVNSVPSHIGQGTTILVANLFKNIPVRKQFYNTNKKKKEEIKKIEDLVIAFGIIRHDVRFCLKHNKDTIWQKGAIADRRSVLMNVLGTSILNQLHPIKKHCLDPDVKLEAYVPKRSSAPDKTSKSSNDRCFIFVNHRPVVMGSIEKLIRKLCHQYCEHERTKWPVFFLHLEFPPSDLDVNVDPNKHKVMIHNQVEVLEFVKATIEDIYDDGSNGTYSAADQEKKRQQTPSPLLDDDQVVDSNRSPNNREDDLSSCVIYKDVKTQNTGGDPALPQLPPPSPVTQQHQPEPQLCPEKSYLSSTQINIDPHIKPSIDSADNVTPNRFDVSEIQTYSPLTPSVRFLVFDDNDDDLFLTDPLVLKKLDDAATQASKEADDSSLPTHADLPTTPETSVTDLTTDAQNNEGDPATSHGGCVDEAGGIHEGEDTSSIPVQILSDAGTAMPTRLTDWSTGIGLSTSTRLGPVTLLTARPKTSSHNVSGDSSMVADKTASAASAPGQASLLDYVANAPGERPSIGFIYYSREVRPKVLASRTDASLQEVAKVISDKWKALSPHRRKEYEDTSRREELWEKEQVTVKERSMVKLVQQAQKKRIQEQSSRRNSLEKMFSNQPPNCGIKTVIGKLQMEDLKRAEQMCSSQTETNPGEFRLIGPIQSHNVWIGTKDNNLTIFNPIRAQEVLIYHQLLGHHILPFESLERPMFLDESILGGSLLWETLQSMKKNSPEPTDPFTYYTDKRLLHNGFKMRQAKAPSGDVKCEIIGIVKCVSFYGLYDLQEVLEKVAEDSSVSLAESRPPKAKQYLQAEAVRMARTRPQKASRYEVTELLEQLRTTVPDNTSVCFHDKPFMHRLFDLDDVPASQEDAADTDVGSACGEES